MRLYWFKIKKTAFKIKKTDSCCYWSYAPCFDTETQRLGQKVSSIKTNKTSFRMSEFCINRIQKLTQSWNNCLRKEMPENCRNTLAHGWSLAQQGSELPWEQGFPTWMTWLLSRQPRYCVQHFISLNWLCIWMEEPDLWQANGYSMEVQVLSYSSSFQK